MQRISSGLSRSGVICVLVGEQISDDDKVVDEAYAAREANPAIRIIPVLVKDAKAEDLPRRLYALQYTDLTQGDHDSAIKELARFIRRER